MNTFDFTLDFFKFLDECSLYNIYLKGVEVEEKQQIIRFHFAEQHFLGNNTYFFDNDCYIMIDYNVCDNEYAMYDNIIEYVSKRYSIKR